MNPFPFYKQLDSRDCGATCLRMVAKYYGCDCSASQWRDNPYFQYFTGEKVFQKGYPFDPSDFVHFRKRIGKEGAEKLLGLSIRLNLEEEGKETKGKVKEVFIDTTVQEKNITYPTERLL